MRLFRSFLEHEKGSVAIVFALLLVVLLVSAGIGVDYGRQLAARTAMQQALDAAVLAGVKLSPDRQNAVAAKMFEAELGDTYIQNTSVSFSRDGEHRLAGRADGQIKTTLTALLGVKTLDVATASTAETSGEGAAVCILALSRTASQQFLLNSGAKVDAPNCEVHGKSTGSPAAIFNSGTDLKAARICLTGKSIIDNGGRYTNLEKSCAAEDDPFAGRLPVPASNACTQNHGNYNGGNVTLAPGVYCGWFNFNNSPNVTFQPGVYVIKNGGWNVNGGTWRGDGVTFYYADTSKIQFNSAVDVTLTPPASGPYANIMMFEAPNLSPSQFVFNDAKDMKMDGLIYLPSRDVTFNSGSKLSAKSFTLVINTLILNQTNWTLKPSKSNISSGDGNKSARLVR
ncbi:hypothetical protein W911_13895 [Hyphomicrobium nitrativorans NL23]|uniref:Putative Flp pilus-assembly TadG-like N-terminal domain-containing protein n=1 Tax=Hyphomicrobium nitrativorans NL23 TaxID=1029756 RepID=V5SGU8_9HYPH|nr:Tad domain-containing protein [Hyphomicrobium nitrativorans]AHB49260.1 hypothetical protein W911_13895 [Hyphomicrobium nitrativorans NL23]